MLFFISFDPKAAYSLKAIILSPYALNQALDQICLGVSKDSYRSFIRLIPFLTIKFIELGYAVKQAYLPADDGVGFFFFIFLLREFWCFSIYMLFGTFFFDDVFWMVLSLQMCQVIESKLIHHFCILRLVCFSY